MGGPSLHLRPPGLIQIIQNHTGRHGDTRIDVDQPGARMSQQPRQIHLPQLASPRLPQQHAPAGQFHHLEPAPVVGNTGADTQRRTQRATGHDGLRSTDAYDNGRVKSVLSR